MATAQQEEPDGPDDGGGSDDPDPLEDLAYVGPRTAERLAAADVSVDAIRAKRVSYREIVAAGVNPGVAGKLRREHSLHWTLDERDADLDRRSEQVRGLSEGERAWVAAARSDDGEDERADDADGATGADGGRDADDATDADAAGGAGDWPGGGGADELPRRT